MMHYGMPFSPMVFIPFMGAVIATKEQPRDAWQDAMIAFGGPALGTAGAMAVAGAAQATDSQLLYALADFGYMINLFNMMPIGSMDGGRIAGALSPWFGVAGLAGGAGLAYTGVVQNPLFYLILLAGGFNTFQQFYDPAAHRPPHYYRITPMQRAAIGTSYFGLCATLLLAMSANQVNKKSPEEIRRYQELHFDEREF
jgi:Zn-dependent protease